MSSTEKSRGKTRSAAADDKDTSDESPENPQKRVKTEQKSRESSPKRATGGPPTSSSKREVRASYYMKLFDRSVDLAKFNVDDPLYPICREWMKNTSRNKSKVPATEDYEEEPLPRKKVPEIMTMIRNGIAAEVKFLPPIEHKQMTKVPDLLEFQRDLDKDQINLKYDLDEPLVPKDDLMEQNMERWKSVKANWQSHLKEYDSQYHSSFEIIDAILKK